MKKPFLLVLVCMSCIVMLRAQSIPFAQYNMVPLAINPALTGGIEDGTYRFSGLYQYQEIKPGPYQLYYTSNVLNISGDIKLFESALNNKGYFGIGGMLNEGKITGYSRDYTGNISLSYTQALDEVGNYKLSGGIQYAYAQNSIVMYYNSYFPTPFYLPNQYPQFSYSNLNAGLAFKGYFSNKFTATVGLAFFNINQPRVPQYDVYTQRLPILSVVHLDTRIAVSKKVILYPSLLFQLQEPDQTVTLGSYVGWDRSSSSSHRHAMQWYIGEHFRLGDAAITTVGVIRNGLRIGLSYAANVSTLYPESQVRRNFELAVSYTGGRATGHRNNVLIVPRF